MTEVYCGNILFGFGNYTLGINWKNRVFVMQVSCRERNVLGDRAAEQQAEPTKVQFVHS